MTKLHPFKIVVAAGLAAALHPAPARADIVLGAGVGPRTGGSPSSSGGFFAGEIGATFPGLGPVQRPRFRWGFALEARIAMLSGSMGTLGGSDLALVSRIQWRVGPTYLGARSGVVGRFYQFKPDGGDRQNETKQLGFTIGPELAWPVWNHTAFEARLSYESSNSDIDDSPNAHPPHAVDLFLGLAREF